MLKNNLSVLLMSVAKADFIGFATVYIHLHIVFLGEFLPDYFP
jgi:hypothetical protein